MDTRYHTWVAVLVLLCSLALISACGGGGGASAPGPTGPAAPPTTGALKVSAASTRALFQNMTAVYNNAGKGVIVWEENNGMLSRVIWAYYDGAAMQPESELGANGVEPAVATNGTDFMLVWNNGGQIMARTCSSVGVLGATTPISSGSAYEPDIASNGSGYAVAWRTMDSSVSEIRAYVNIFSASTWTAERRIDNLPGHDFGTKIASNGSGYAVTWMKNETGVYSVYATVSTGGTGTTAWAAPSPLDNLSTSVWGPGPGIASNGSGYSVAWYHHDGVSDFDVYANIYSSGSWSSGGTLLEGLVDSPDTSNPPGIASNGSGYAVAWSHYSGGTYHTYINIFSGGTWTSAAAIDGGSLSSRQEDIATNGAGYAVAWSQYNGTSYDIYAAMSSGGTVTATWPAPVLLDASTATATSPRAVRFPAGSGYAVLWHQNDASGYPNYFAARSTATTWSAPEQIVQGVWKGSAHLPLMATNRNGISMAVWPEYQAGTGWLLYGSINATGGWSTPFLIGNTRQAKPSLATDGTAFMVAWSSSVHNYAIVSVTCASDGTLGTVTKISPSGTDANYPDLASNGSGYGAVWDAVDGGVRGIFSNVYSNGSWSIDGGGNPTPWHIESGSGYAYEPQIASNGAGYGAIWNQHDGISYSIYANLFTNGTWSVGGTVLENLAGSSEWPAIASNGTGYAVAWTQHDGANISAFANIYSAGSWSTGGTLLENGAFLACCASIASNGSGYAVAWQQSDGSYYNIFANIYSAGTWSTGGTLIDNITHDAYSPSIASDGSGYAVSWHHREGAIYNAYYNVYSSGTWSTGGTLLETNGGDAGDTMMISNGNKYSVIWWQRDPADTITFDIWSRLGI